MKYAVQHALDDPLAMEERRSRVREAIEALAAALDDEYEASIYSCAALVAGVLRAFSSPNNVALVRELQLVAQLQDAAAP